MRIINNLGAAKADDYVPPGIARRVVFIFILYRFGVSEVKFVVKEVIR